MGCTMLRKVFVTSLALAAFAAFTGVLQPAEAGSCAVLSENAIGLKQADAADRAKKQLKRKISRWGEKHGYKVVRVGSTSTVCIKKGSIAHCTASAKACG